MDPEARSRARDAPVPSAPGPPLDRDDGRRALEKRLEDVVSTIQEFAELRFAVRAPVGPDGDIVDAVAAGVNFLGEELDASFRDLEHRVADRTAEITLATEELRRRSLHDGLTGLANRALGLERLSHRLELANRRRDAFAVLFLDLDEFKVVNDTLGHAAGDRLLVDVAARLRLALRSGDAVARMGGDEFVVLLDEVATEETAMAVAERLGAALREPYEIAGKPRIVPASIGVAVGPAGFRTADDVVAAADAAMYEAKRRGGGRCVLYRESPHRLRDA